MVHKPESLHKFKVRKLKTLCQLASLQTSQLKRPEFAFLCLIQRLEVPELILKEKLCWPRGTPVGFHNFGCHNSLWICVRFLCATRFDSHSFAAKGLYSVFFPLLWLAEFSFPGPDLWHKSFNSKNCCEFNKFSLVDRPFRKHKDLLPSL